MSGAWLAARQPRPPEPLAAVLASVPAAAAAAPRPRALADAGLDALRRALALGDARPAAYELLAADALLTYAIERAAEAGVEPLAELLDSLPPAAFAPLLGGKE